MNISSYVSDTVYMCVCVCSKISLPLFHQANKKKTTNICKFHQLWMRDKVSCFYENNTHTYISTHNSVLIYICLAVNVCFTMLSYLMLLTAIELAIISLWINYRFFSLLNAQMAINGAANCFSMKIRWRKYTYIIF